MVEVLNDLVVITHNRMTAIGGNVTCMDAGYCHALAYGVAIAHNH